MHRAFRRSAPRRRPRPFRALATPLALLAMAPLGPAACLSEAERRGPVPPAPDATGHPEFADARELLRAIERGTFAARAGVDTSAAPEPPPPTTVRFERGTALPREAVPKLHRLARRLAAEPRWTVSVEGCSDPSGPAALNRRISRQRAGSVAEALREEGLAAERIAEVVGRGEACEVAERAVHVTASAPPEPPSGRPDPTRAPRP